jgi:hypothetical protein
MITYMMGTNPPQWLEPALQEWQSLIDDVMVNKFGFHHEELHDHPQSPMIWSSTRDGGLGFVDARQTAQRIWLTSAAYAAPDISAFVNAKNQRSAYFTSLGIAWELIRNPIVTSPSYQRDIDAGTDISQPIRVNNGEQRASPLSRKLVHQLLSSSIGDVIDRFSGSTVPHGFAKQLSHYQRAANMDLFLQDHPRGDPVHERVIDCQNKVTSTILNLPVSVPEFIVPDFTFKPFLRNRAGFEPHPQMSRGYTCGMCNTYVDHPDHHFQQCRPASSSRTDCHNIIANVLASAATQSGFASHGEVVLSSIINRRVRTIQVRHKQQASISLSAIARDRVGRNDERGRALAALATVEPIGYASALTKRLLHLKPDGAIYGADGATFYDVTIPCVTTITHCKANRIAAAKKSGPAHGPSGNQRGRQVHVINAEKAKQGKYLIPIHETGRQLGDRWLFEPLVISAHGTLGDRFYMFIGDLAAQATAIGNTTMTVGRIIALVQIALAVGNAHIHASAIRSFATNNARTYHAEGLSGRQSQHGNPHDNTRNDETFDIVTHVRHERAPNRHSSVTNLNKGTSLNPTARPFHPSLSSVPLHQRSGAGQVAPAQASQEYKHGNVARVDDLHVHTILRTYSDQFRPSTVADAAVTTVVPSSPISVSSSSSSSVQVIEPSSYVGTQPLSPHITPPLSPTPHHRPPSSSSSLSPLLSLPISPTTSPTSPLTYSSQHSDV